MKHPERFTDPDKKAKEIALEQDPVVPEFKSWEMPIIKNPWPPLPGTKDWREDFPPSAYDTLPPGSFF